MTRHDLRSILEALGIRPDAYDLDGRVCDECLCLERGIDGWVVFYAERGLRSNERHFDSEDAACRYLVDRLRRDPTTRASAQPALMPEEGERRLSDEIADKVLTFRESSMGAYRVTLVLRDGSKVPGVVIAWGRELVRWPASPDFKAMTLWMPSTRHRREERPTQQP
jgi:hypothetical protein